MKVFGIGLSKTGTTSLTEALRLLGLSSIHNPSSKLYFEDNGDLSLYSNFVNDVDSVTDIEIAHFHKELDKKFPESKFVLTARDLESWLKSCSNHFNKNLNPTKEERALLKLVYGSETFSRDLFEKAYLAHQECVVRYFKNRESDLLILPVECEDKMERLCSFLGMPAMKVEYPKVNKAFPLPSKLKQFLRSFPILMKLRNRLR